MRATVRDVARLAGVSAKTVSNVVNDSAPVSAATRIRVERALTQLDYVPNLTARGLRNGRTGVIGLALPDLSTPYSAVMTHHLVDRAARFGWRVQIEETGDSGARREAELVSRAQARLVDGLILDPIRLEASGIQRGVSLPPIVLIGEVDQPVADHVWIDNVAASRAITTLLIEHGHRRIGVLGIRPAATSRLREQGYRAAHGDAGLPIDPELEIRCSVWSPGGSYRATANWLERHRPPDALFCMTDSLALGALHAFADAGIRVPDEVSVVGYDDVPEAAHYTPPLTTVGFDKALFAETVLRRLADRIDDPDEPITTSTVDFRIVERESVRRR